MKKVFVLLLVMVSFLSLAGCKRLKNREYAGTYELYYMSGSFSLSDFEYYTITLEKNGDCKIASKSPYNSQVYSATATYEVEDGKIYIYSKVGGATVTEVYDYVDGEIHMLNQNLYGYTFTAKFKRK